MHVYETLIAQLYQHPNNVSIGCNQMKQYVFVAMNILLLTSSISSRPKTVYPLLFNNL